MILLSNEGLCESDVHIDLEELCLWELFCQFLVFVEGKRDVLDGLF